MDTCHGDHEERAGIDYGWLKNKYIDEQKHRRYKRADMFAVIASLQKFGGGGAIVFVVHRQEDFG